MNPNQLTLPNTTSTMSTKTNFGQKFILIKTFEIRFIDQLTTNVPQGAKRSANRSKVSIKVDENSDKSDLSEKENLHKLDIENVGKRKFE